jgi:uncharacterized protein
MRVSLLLLLLATGLVPPPVATSAAVGCVYVQPFPTEVHDVIRKRSPAVLRKWIAWNREALDAVDPDSGRTPLMTALITEKPKHFRLLLKSGTKPDLTDGVGNSALHVAAQINEPWHVLAMLEAGANPTLRNTQGHTFQHYLFMTPERSLDKKTQNGIAAVIQWLTAKGLVVETTSGYDKAE